MEIIYAFILGGLICMIGQFLMDKFKLMPIYITCLFVVIGSALELFGIYDKLVEFGHMGAMIPISSFGHSVAHSVVLSVKEEGFLGIFTGLFENVSVGIGVAIFYAFIVALVSRPRG